MFKFNLYIIAIGITLFPKVSNADIKLSDEIFRERQTPERDKRLSIELFKNKYFFSSLAFAKNYIAEINKIDPKFEIILEKLIIKTGTISFSYMQEKVLIKHQQTPSMALAYGLRLGQKKKWGRALGVLKNIPNNHRFSSEARLMEGAAYNILNKDLEAEQAYQQCHKMAKVLENASEAKRQKRYYSILKESCAINLARLEYKNANYDKAMDLYNSVPKTSFRWPFMLIEKAWTAYKQEDYNRSLGIIVTYKSPLLSSYFLPEAEVLSSLSYYKLCLYQDSLKIIEQYYNVYRKRSNALRELLIRHKISHTFFLKMMFAPISKVEKINPYIRNLLTQIRKKIKFSIDLVAYKRVQNELKVVQKLSKLELTSLLENELKESLRWRTIHLNHFIKKKMFDFINDIHRFSYEMFNIKLQVLSKKRDLVWKNKQLIADRSRGSHDNIRRNINQHFYDFRGEFWADELGDYSFGLKSNCQTIREMERPKMVNKR